MASPSAGLGLLLAKSGDPTDHLLLERLAFVLLSFVADVAPARQRMAMGCRTAAGS